MAVANVGANAAAAAPTRAQRDCRRRRAAAGSQRAPRRATRSNGLAKIDHGMIDRRGGCRRSPRRVRSLRLRSKSRGRWRRRNVRVPVKTGQAFNQTFTSSRLRQGNLRLRSPVVEAQPCGWWCGAAKNATPERTTMPCRPPGQMAISAPSADHNGRGISTCAPERPPPPPPLVVVR